ncbi:MULTISPECIES: hypothetical protein [Bacillota]|uniref:hypothetical protein n=1 Tax=Bacillota TaxID=1239 RepID=UPI0011C18305|nr:MULTISPECIES: hypothetical protein [Bacillota]
MIITKNKKVLHKELNMIFKIFKQEDGEEIIFVEDNTLYFASNCIAGRVRIRNFNGENMLQIESGIYQLKQLPRKDFILDLLHFEEKNEGIIGVKTKLKNILARKKVISCVEDTGHKVSDTIKLTGLVLRDSHCKMIMKMKDFTVGESGFNLVTEEDEEYEKENLFVNRVMIFMGYGNEDDK